jgi:hypothetical protein
MCGGLGEGWGMAINDEAYNRLAIKGDVAGVAINVSVALTAIANSLEALKNGDKPSNEDLATIRRLSDQLDKRFEMLTGWTPDKP